MSNKIGNVPLNAPMDGRVIYDYQVGNLEGRILTLIDAIGLKENQEKSVKDMLKGILREALYNETIYVFGDLLQPVIDKENERRKSGGGMPTRSGR